MAMFGYGTLEQEIWDAIIESEMEPTYSELMVALGKLMQAYAETERGEKGEA